jgi:hypothetical protein
VNNTSGDEVKAEYNALACGKEKERKAFSTQPSAFSPAAVDTTKSFEMWRKRTKRREPTTN